MGGRFDAPIGIDDPHFGTAEVCALSGVGWKSIKNWEDRGIIPNIPRNDSRRKKFSLRDALRFAAMNGLVERAGMPVQDAAGAAQVFVREITARLPRDAGGRLLLDLQAIPPDLLLILARVDGEMHVGLVTASHAGEMWGQHADVVVTLPIAATVARVAGRLIELASANG